MVYHDRVYIFMQLIPFGKAVYFCQMFDVLFGFYNPIPPRPKTPFTYVVYVYSDMSLSKGHFRSRGGKASKNKLRDTSFTFPVTNVTILSIFRTHAQEGYRKVLEMNSTSIPYSLALLLFENWQSIYSKSGLNGTQ